MADLSDFLDALDALSISGVTMVEGEPATAPADDELPIAWVERPTLIGEPPVSSFSPAIREYRVRAAVLVALAVARQGEQRLHRDDLITYAEALRDALNSITSFTVSYEMALDARVQAQGWAFYGLAAVVTGE